MNAVVTKSNSTVPPVATRRIRRVPHRYDLIFTDLGLLNLAFLLAGLVVYRELDTANFLTRHLPLIGVVNVVWVALALHFEAYRWYERVRIEQQLGKVLKIIVLHFALVTIFYYQVLYHSPTSGFLWLTYTLAIGLVCGGRVAHHLRLRGRGMAFRYVIVGGKGENIQDLFEAFEHSFHDQAELVGRFGNTEYDGVKNIGSYHDIRDYLLTQPDIQKLIFFYSDLNLEEKREILRICEGQFIDVEIAPRETSIFPRGYKGQQHGDMFILTLKQEPLTLLRNKIVKRAFDILVSGGVILFIFPWLIPIVALLIKRAGPGPVFFIQPRSGYHNEVFPVIKFRTMNVNAGANDIQATKDDDRKTKIGDFLRKTSLDEFPQFFNVFLGQMSVVGPRPHMLKHTEQYSAIIDTYMIRHKIKPGVTGWAQVNGFRGPTDELWKMQKRVEYDVRYLENWSLPLDIRCMVMTVLNAVRGESNAF